MKVYEVYQCATCGKRMAIGHHERSEWIRIWVPDKSAPDEHPIRSETYCPEHAADALERAGVSHYEP